MKNPALALLVPAALLAACAQPTAPRPSGDASTSPGGASPTPATATAIDDGATPMSLEERLTPLQYQVTQQCGTEPPFQNEYWDNHEPGLYVDIINGEPRFASIDKFESGSGWPSFTKPIEAEAVQTKADRTLGMVRTEVRSADADSHLGHVFEDGPGPNGLRYCINSASLRFVHLRDLEAEGYGAYLDLFPAELRASAGVGASGDSSAATATTETAILAGGCFWGMEDILRELPGVLDTEVGYSGGTLDNPTYADMRTGRTGHAEAIRIVFDPARITYGEILDTFFRMHDPTTLNRQGNDTGTQYRSAIFFLSDAQRAEAEKAVQRANESGRWKKPVVTEVTKASAFWPAEDYHQDYLEKNPGGYTCHYLRK